MSKRLQGIVVLALAVLAAAALAGTARSSGSTGSSGAPIPQGTQSDAAFAASNAGIPNVFATTQQTSCYRPEVAAPFDDGPAPATTASPSAPARRPARTRGRQRRTRLRPEATPATR